MTATRQRPGKVADKPVDEPTKAELAKLEVLTKPIRDAEHRELRIAPTSSTNPVSLLADPWPDLVSLGAIDLPRLPVNVLPGWAGQYAAALASATETPPELAAGMILAAAAVPCARRMRLLVAKGHFEPCNLWVAVALAPGNRKSAVQQAVCRPLLDWERDAAARVASECAAAESHNKTLQARIKVVREQAARAEAPGDRDTFAQEAAALEVNLKPAVVPPQLWTSDATPERLGSILYDQGECLAWLSSEAGLFDMLGGRYSRGLNLDLVLKAWSGDAERVDRAGRPPVYLECPRLTIGISPQPDVLRGLSDEPGFRGRGLLGRFVYLLPPSTLGYRDLGPDRPGAEVSGHLEAAYHAGIKAMLDWPAAMDDAGRECTHPVRLTPEAHREWLGFARQVEADMRPGGDYEGVTDLAGKIPGIAARIAAVFHGIAHAHGRPWETPITPATMVKALEAAAVTLRHGLAVMDMVGADQSIAAARKIWEWLERGRRTKATLREVFQALKSTFPRVAALNVGLDALVERGYVKLEEPPPSGSAGRPASPTIKINPVMLRRWK